LSQIITVPTAIPGGTGTFTRIETPTTDGSNYWFVGRGIGQFGIYKKNGGVLSTLLDQNTIVTGTTSRFTSVGNLSSDGGMNTSFTGEFANASGVFDLMGSTLSKIADTSTKIPGGNGLFSTFGVSSAGGSSVAFVGFDQNRKPGIYAWIGGELNRVIDSSVSLGGRIISSLDMTTTAVAGNKLVFKADFTDGTSGVYTASLFPTRVPGDVNNDGKVDAADFAIVQKNLGASGGRSLGDLNGDGTIDFLDFQVLERNFGHSGIAPLLGDANGDGIVDRTDLKTLFANYGKYGSIAQADFNGDGGVDFTDYQALELNYGKVSAAVYEPFGAAGVGADEVLASSTPEPGGLGIVLMALGALAARRRQGAGIR
jgi:MYXO-CTERM domain-containing protein